MAEVTRSESSSASCARAQQTSERGNRARSASTIALQRVARDRALPARVTPDTALALQRAVGNRAVATTVARQPRRMLQRTGKIIAGTFAASVGGEEKVIQVIPWRDLNGRNNNFLYID